MTAPVTVATVLEADERPTLDAAGEGWFSAVHANNLREALRAVRERPVQAVLVSPRCISPHDGEEMLSLVHGFPGVATVAVLSRHDARVSERLLALGAYGIRDMVDLSHGDGWRRLRDLVAHPMSPSVAAILARILPAMGEVPDDCRLFFRSLVQLAPGTCTVRLVARRLAVRPTSLMSRFLRAGLPSPKKYLSATRLMHASALLEMKGMSVADMAYRLEYSSPQSFGRHLRALMGVTAGEFRDRYPLDRALTYYCDTLITPYRSAFRTFHPLIHQGVARLGQGKG